MAVALFTLREEDTWPPIVEAKEEECLSDHSGILWIRFRGDEDFTRLGYNSMDERASHIKLIEEGIARNDAY